MRELRNFLIYFTFLFCLILINCEPKTTTTLNTTSTFPNVTTISTLTTTTNPSSTSTTTTTTTGSFAKNADQVALMGLVSNSGNWDPGISMTLVADYTYQVSVNITNAADEIKFKTIAGSTTNWYGANGTYDNSQLGIWWTSYTTESSNIRINLTNNAILKFQFIETNGNFKISTN